MVEYINNDTVCAVSTPAGSGAIAVVRLTGNRSLEIIEKIFHHSKSKGITHSTCTYGTIYDGEDIVDEVLVSFFKSPHSYTGEDIVEISCHGSRYIQQKILELLVKHGARIALPGEFTFRAFRNKKLDLTQSEAVADLIASENRKSHDIAISQLKGNYSQRIKQLKDKLTELLSLLELELDFSDEEVEFAQRDEFISLLTTIENELQSMINSFELGNTLRNGIPVAIIGKPNVGKSTLLNCLLNEEKAIVSEIPGTTRDVIEDIINIDGYLFRFIDTAGLHKTDDEIENKGIERTIDMLRKAMIVLHVFDVSNIDREQLLEEKTEFSKYLSDSDINNIMWIMVGNKVDSVESLPSCYSELEDMDTIYISAKRHENIEMITDRLCKYVKTNDISDSTVVTSARHYDSMQKALEEIMTVKKSFSDNVPTDLISIDLHLALYNLSVIIGDVTTDDVLDTIFSRFCIGK